MSEFLQCSGHVHENLNRQAGFIHTLRHPYRESFCCRDGYNGFRADFSEKGIPKRVITIIKGPAEYLFFIGINNTPKVLLTFRGGFIQQRTDRNAQGTRFNPGFRRLVCVNAYIYQCLPYANALHMLMLNLCKYLTHANT